MPFIFPVGFLAPSSSGSGFRPIPATLLGSASMIQLVNGNVDDGSVNIGDIGFDFPFYENSYRNNIFVGSNGYITFGSGSGAYSGLSTTTPGRALLVAAGDRSYQQVFVLQDTPRETFRIRYEGSSSTGGTVGNPNMLWEATLFKDGTIQLVTGVLANTQGVSVITDGDGVNFTNYIPDADNSYVFLRESPILYTVQIGSYGTTISPPINTVIAWNTMTREQWNTMTQERWNSITRN